MQRLSEKVFKKTMRLSEKEKISILQAVHQKDAEAEVYLFGSRADDSARGGDIDILIISNKLNYSDKIDIKLDLYKHIGEQKIDIVVDRDKIRPFTRMAASQGIRL
jgi:predicted nucleotidyltransferase